MNESMQNLFIGKTLVGVDLAPDRAAVRLRLSDSPNVIGECYGDCCSTTWIESLTFPAMGLPALIMSADDLDMPDLGPLPDCDVVTYYGCKIVTTHGELIIDYRNDSNGFYGGDLHWRTEDHYEACAWQPAVEDSDGDKNL